MIGGGTIDGRSSDAYGDLGDALLSVNMEEKPQTNK
jgi:hypothetical protein